MSGPLHSSRRRTRRRARWLRPLLVVLAGVTLFLLGIGLGQALEDQPTSGTRTQVRTLTPLPLAPARDTVTVTVTGSS